MPNQPTTFLRNPPEIRKAICTLQSGKELCLAVAFVGADWNQLLSDYQGSLRVVCWLSSTNTNPYAVESLMKRRDTNVKQRNSMHCKVYLAPKFGAVVGSANLSQAALSEDDISGQDEAAVLVVLPSIVGQIGDWFEALWNDRKTHCIKEPDIVAAKVAYDKRPRSAAAKKTRGDRNIPALPAQFDKQVFIYAEKVRAVDLRQDLKDLFNLVTAINPANLTRGQQQSLVDGIVSWTRHPGSYKNFMRQPISKVRKGLQVLFDNSVETQARLEEIQRESYLSGLRMPSLSLLLYWKNPELFPPYNHRTKQFLKDFGLGERGMSASSPKCYVMWLRWATRFGQKLNLPTVGHVDRMVERYYEDHYQE